MASDGGEVDREIGRLGALAEPVRRDLYQFVVAAEDAVSREQAAAGVGVAHHVAKFHLDRLEADGLLEVEFRRPPGRTGPGAGRPAKFYRRSRWEISVSLPERRYELAGSVMADAIAASSTSGSPIDVELREAAVAAGRRLGADARQRVDADADAITRLRNALDRQGYESIQEGDVVALRNCPFHALAATHTSLVCGMNLDLLNGALDELRPHDWSARLNPAPGRCCVTLERHIS